ncbi:calcium-binding protein [Ensifer sp. ENS11]|uniref:calcium-binding protein n=1 Tax=Ensifer sp. ENS11 TaxID=2769291 RepID=UPI00177F963C|nr:calcium-binding protein [Ensifer sp. ENS11]MBD9490470.1 hypothetical protein [Ensifer sp. ENS11]
MAQTIGIGISVSFGEGAEVSIQRSLVRDGATGNWYFVETYFEGLSAGVVPLDGSFDLFVFEPGIGISDITGAGSYQSISSIASAGLIRNSDGEVIGVQGGLVSNLGYGAGITNTTVTPLELAGQAVLEPIRTALVAALVGLALFGPQAALAALAWGFLISPLLQVLRDPLVIDLDGDGVELSSLAESNVHFDYDRDGFAEKTGWVSADDGILVIDSNNNSSVDGTKELFGSPSQDGFAVLETLDGDRDGKIDEKDAAFAQLRVWRDLDQDGVSDAGELMTLAEAGIASISLNRTDVIGTNNGHGIGFEAGFIRTDGTMGSAQTIYFETDRQNTRGDNTPGFVVADGVNLLPQLPGTGQINSIAWKATQDAAFRSAWTALTDQASTLSLDELRSGFESLLLKWAGVDTLGDNSRGAYVNAQHLVFVEKFFGSQYQEIGRGQEISTSPNTAATGSAIEASFDQVVDTLLTAFLSQVGGSVLSRGGDFDSVISSPYFAYAVLDFSKPEEGSAPTYGNVGQVLTLLTQLLPQDIGAAAAFLAKGLGGLEGVAPTIFAGNRTNYLTVAEPALAGLSNPVLKEIATAIVKGNAAFGSSSADGLVRIEGDNLFDAGRGEDILISGVGNDIFIYRAGDGTDLIRDTSTSTVEIDTLVLADLAVANLVFERVGETLRIRVAGTEDAVLSEGFFRNWGEENRGIDRIMLKDGTLLSRADIAKLTTAVGDDRNNEIQDTALDDVLRAGAGDDRIVISGGNDTVLYAVGDGYDTIADRYLYSSGTDTLKLVGLLPADVELSRVGADLVILIKSSGEFVRSEGFFNPGQTAGEFGDLGVDRIEFENGVIWNKAAIVSEAWLRGNGDANAIAGTKGDDVLVGGRGNDTLDGNQGSDRYIWSAGDGNDKIVDGGADATPASDSIVLQNIRSGEVELFRRGTSLVINIKATGETIEVQDQFYSVTNIKNDWNKTTHGVERIEFADGVTFNRETLMKSIVNVGFDLDFKYWFEWFGGNDLPSEFSEAEELVFADLQSGIAEVESRMAGSGGGGGGGGGTAYRSALEGISFVDELGRTGNFYDIQVIVKNYAKLDSSGNDILFGDENNERIGGAYYNSASEQGLPEPGTAQPIPGSPGGSLVDLIASWPSWINNTGHNYFDGRSGNDTLIGGAGHDLLVGGTGNDTLYGDSETEVGDLGSGHDALEGGDGDDRLFGGGGNDYLNGGFGNDLVSGGDGSDTLVEYGTQNASSDIFVGGRGDDVIVSGFFVGNSGSDTFLYASGDGNDVIIEETASTAEVDVLRLTDIASSEVTLARVGYDLVVRVTSTGETIQSNGFFGRARDLAASVGIDRIDFVDGVSWNREAIWQRAWIRGTEGRDALVADFGGDDTFIGNDGDDLIISQQRGSDFSNGNDTFIYASGDGNDVISDAYSMAYETDTLVLVDLLPTDVELSRVGADLLIRDLKTNQVITARDSNRWQSSDNSYGIDAIRFADGTMWDKRKVFEHAWVRGGASNDSIEINANGDDVYFGDLGDDRIASRGRSNGSDTFVYRLGDGNDAIYESSNSTAEIDTLLLQGISIEDLRLSVLGSGILINILTSGETILDELSLSGGYGIDRIVFGNGQSWSRNEILYWAQDGALFYQANGAANRIIGSHFDQRLGGGAGNDYIDGGLGSDLLFGDGGDDTLAVSVMPEGELDTLDGGDGVDTAAFDQFGSGVLVDLVANGGEARTSGTAFAPSADGRQIATLSNIENVVGSQFNDRLLGDANVNKLSGGSGDDVIDGRSGNDTLFGELGDDALLGYIGNDTLEGGIGADRLEGGAGNDTYVFTFGDGHDVILEADAEGTADILRLKGLAPADVTLVRSGSDLLVSIADDAGGSIRLTGSSGAFRHYDQYGVEEIVFDNGVRWDAAYLRQWSIYASATDGDDILVGTSASGLFGGGKGNDTLDAGAGDDTYVYARGDGNDTITEGTSGTADQLLLQGINPSDVTLVRNGDDVTLAIAESAPGAGDAGSILIKATLNGAGDRGLEKVIFADGTTWTRSDIRVLLLAQANTAGNDVITGFASADVITGGRGDDTINGAEGNDTYVYARGDGNDTITEGTSGTADQLLLQGINPSDVTLVRNGDDVTLAIAESAPGASDAGSILIKATLNGAGDRGLEKVIFADGTTWTRSDIRVLLLAQANTAGNDVITGFASADVITGGRGDDTINGAEGNDTYVYARGDGNDTITDGTTGGTADQLLLQGINPADVTLVRNGDDVTLMVAESAPGAGDAGSILIKATLNGAGDRGLEKVVFSEGTTWTRVQLNSNVAFVGGTNGHETIVGSTGADDIRAGLGNDVLQGLAGNDTYNYRLGDGNDVIDEATTGSDVDTLLLANVTRADVSFERLFNALNDVIIKVAPTGETITLKNQLNQAGGVEKIVFADGTVLGGNDWSLDAILMNAAPIRGTAGNDTIADTSGNDTLIGGTGSDTFNSGAGSDTYVYARGDGNDLIREKSGSLTDVDTLRLTDLNSSDVTFTRSGETLTIGVNGSSEFITVDWQFYKTTENWGLDRIEFANGSVWNRAQIQSAAWIRGTVGNDTISDTIGNDTLIGGAGNDTFNSGAGSDTYVYARADGNDRIKEKSGSVAEVDTLRLTDLNSDELSFTRSGETMTIGVNSTNEVITVDWQFYKTTEDWGLDRIEFANGSVWDRAQIQSAAWIRGTAANDTLAGASSADTLFGDAGNDTLTGGAASDTFVFKPGFGKDTITDFVTGAASDDVLSFDNAVFSTFEAVLTAASQVGADTLISYDANNTITLKNVTIANLHADDVRFVA